MTSSDSSGAGSPPGAPLPPADFQSFILSLASAGMLHLGMIPDPDTGESSTNFPMAEHTIDMLAMLSEKTSGNLSADEQKTLEGLLAELRRRFVSLSQTDQ